MKRLIVALLLTFVTHPSLALISTLQNPAAVQFSSTTTPSATLAALTNGSMIVVAVTVEGGVSGTPTCVDTVNSGGYSKDVDGNATSFGYTRSMVFSHANTSSSTTTVTCTLAASASGFIKLWEITGQATSGVVDATGTLLDDGGNQTSLPITTAQAHDAIFVAVGGYPGGFAVDTGFTQSFAAGGGSMYNWGEYYLDSGSAQARSLTFGLSLTGSYGGGAVAYKAAGIGPSQSPSQFFLSTHLPVQPMLRHQRRGLILTSSERRSQ